MRQTTAVDEDIDRALSVCGYCLRPIAEEEEGFIRGAVIESSEGFGPDEFRGQGVEIVRADDSIIGCIPDEESDLAAEGSNLALFVCSKACGKAADAFLALPQPVELRPLPEDLVPRRRESKPWWNPFRRR